MIRIDDRMFRFHCLARGLLKKSAELERSFDLTTKTGTCQTGFHTFTVTDFDEFCLQFVVGRGQSDHVRTGEIRDLKEKFIRLQWSGYGRHGLSF